MVRRTARGVTCRGKASFPNPQRAYLIAARQSRRYHEPFNHYHCPACGFWHTGHQEQGGYLKRPIDPPRDNRIELPNKEPIE